MNDLLDGSKGTQTIQLKESTPAYVLAYDRYNDAKESDTISSRNDIINPLFLPVSELKVNVK